METLLQLDARIIRFKEELRVLCSLKVSVLRISRAGGPPRFGPVLNDSNDSDRPLISTLHCSEASISAD